MPKLRKRFRVTRLGVVARADGERVVSPTRGSVSLLRSTSWLVGYGPFTGIADSILLSRFYSPSTPQIGYFRLARGRGAGPNSGVTARRYPGVPRRVGADQVSDQGILVDAGLELAAIALTTRPGTVRCRYVLPWADGLIPSPVGRCNRPVSQAALL